MTLFDNPKHKKEILKREWQHEFNFDPMIRWRELN